MVSENHSTNLELCKRWPRYETGSRSLPLVRLMPATILIQTDCSVLEKQTPVTKPRAGLGVVSACSPLSEKKLLVRTAASGPHFPPPAIVEVLQDYVTNYHKVRWTCSGHGSTILPVRNPLWLKLSRLKNPVLDLHKRGQ